MRRIQRIGACVGGLALAGALGCTSGGEWANARMPAPALAFEISAELAEACTPSGRARILAADLVEGEPVAARAHDGWLSVAFTSLERGRMTLDLEPRTLNVLVAGARSQVPAHDTGALTAVDANGHGLHAFLVPGPNGVVLAAAPLECAAR